MTFANQIAAFAKKTGQSMDRTVRAVCAQLSTEIIQRTPVDVGTLKGSWMPTINAPSSELGTPDKDGSRTIAKAVSVAQQAAGNVFYLVNNQKYARVMEYGLWGAGPGATIKTTRDGYSVQAPYGAVRVSVQLFDKLLRDAVRNP